MQFFLISVILFLFRVFFVLQTGRKPFAAAKGGKAKQYLISLQAQGKQKAKRQLSKGEVCLRFVIDAESLHL